MISRQSKDDGTYEWYLAGYDFLVARWNYICRHEDAQLGELPRVLDRIVQMKADAWGEKVGNPKS